MQNAALEQRIKKEEERLANHFLTKNKQAEIVRLEKELAAIEKNNKMLKLIELQYQREIDRRKKKEERDKLEEEMGEKIIDSPLRRAREYAQNIAGE